MDVMLNLITALTFGTLRLTWAIIGALLGVLKSGWDLFRERKRLTTHGDADWATDKELKASEAFEPRGFLLCFTNSGKRVFGRKNRGAIVIAGPGQGKSQNVLANFKAKALLHYEKREHLFVHDISNELWQHGKPILEKLGYSCEKIDLVDPSAGVAYDVQSYLDFKSMHYKTSLKALTHGLIAPEPGSRQPHFVDFARIMLEDVLTLNQMEGGGKTVPECVDELMSKKKREALFKRMELAPYDFNAMDIFSRMKGDEGIGMESTTLRKLDPWLLDSIREVSKVERTPEKPCGWTFDEMLTSEKPCALFVRTGLAPGGGEFARAVFMNLVNSIRRQWDIAGRESPRGIQAFVDEFARLGTCTALIEGFGELRKAGFSIWIGALSYADMEDLYGKGAKKLFNGSDHIILPGNQDMEVNEVYSRMIGEMTIESGSHSQSAHGESSGKNEQARRRVKADEIRREKVGSSFAIVENLAVKGLATFYIKKGKPVLR